MFSQNRTVTDISNHMQVDRSPQISRLHMPRVNRSQSFRPPPNHQLNDMHPLAPRHSVNVRRQPSLCCRSLQSSPRSNTWAAWVGKTSRTKSLTRLRIQTSHWSWKGRNGERLEENSGHSRPSHQLPTNCHFGGCQIHCRVQSWISIDYRHCAEDKFLKYVLACS